jgi:hypothetical protein
MIVRTRQNAASGGTRFRPVAPDEMAAVASLFTAIPAARDGRGKGLMAVSQE